MYEISANFFNEHIARFPAPNPESFGYNVSHGCDMAGRDWWLVWLGNRNVAKYRYSLAGWRSALRYCEARSR